MNTPEQKLAVEAELAQITTDLEAIAKFNPETKDWAAIPDTTMMGNPDMDETSDATEEWNERRALMPQLETRYRNLVSATEKITANTYGTCEVCENQIEEARLAANVAARTCKTHLEDESDLPQ